MTPKEYLAFERAAETRHEYLDGEIFDTAGTTYGHTRIKDNLARHLGNRFEHGPYEILTTDLRVKIDLTGLYTYPDIIVLCGDGEYEDGELDTLLNPTAIIESCPIRQKSMTAERSSCTSSVSRRYASTSSSPRTKCSSTAASGNRTGLGTS
jgi:hypothetical protein